MIKAIILIITLSVATQMQTCKKKEKKDDNKVSVKSEQVMPVQKVVIDRSMTPIEEIKDLKIEKASITDSLLSVTFSYEGTPDDSFNMVFNGMYLKSLPMQATIKLQQVKAEGKVLSQTKTLVFNVAPMKASGTELHIKVENFPEKLVYKY